MNLQTIIDRSARKLVGVHPSIREKALVLVQRCHAENIFIQVTQGLRTMAQQEAIYAQGRTTAGSIVSNAKPGYSYHNYGLAFDIVVLTIDGKANWTVNSEWNRAGKIGQSLGLEWGGAWTNFVDYPHFQITFGLTTAQLRAGTKVPGMTSLNEGALRLGATGPTVTKLQKDLNSVGFKLAADGNFGPLTDAALRSFQKRNHLHLDGIAGSQTLSKLATLVERSKMPVPNPTLRLGISARTAVKQLQTLLNALGHGVGKVDGLFGPNTEKAVKDLQKQANISADGIYGPTSNRKLKEML